MLKLDSNKDNIKLLSIYFDVSEDELLKAEYVNIYNIFKMIIKDFYAIPVAIVILVK